jgi:hypothetical protein
MRGTCIPLSRAVRRGRWSGCEPGSQSPGQVWECSCERRRTDINLTRFVGGQAASLGWKEAANKRDDTDYDDDRVTPYYRQLYFDHDLKLDPCTTGPAFAAIGEAVATSMRFSARNFSTLDFIGSRRSPGPCRAALDKSAAHMAFLFRDERHGVADDETLRRVRLIVPHVRRAALMARWSI